LGKLADSCGDAKSEAMGAWAKEDQESEEIVSAALKYRDIVEAEWRM
jgi:hypothetical protein